MARRNEAERLLREGLYPSQIAARMNVSVKSVVQYLRTQVGEGSLRLSDLYFSWPPQKREILQKAGRKYYPDDRLLSMNDLSRDDFQLFNSLCIPRVFRGDLYEYVSDTEVAIHRLVRDRLEREFGLGEHGWWRKGIPKGIREKCASRREEDDDPCEEPYAYTTLIELKVTIINNWKLLKGELPTDYSANRKLLESHLNRLNRIRNSVMHPVKNRTWSDDDFYFARTICALFKSSST